MFTAMPASFGGASAPAMRYWRVYISSGNDAYCSFSNIELRESIGGADATGTGTASASQTSEGSAANAFDGTNSYWATNLGAGAQWIKYDFGPGNGKAIVELQLKARDDSYAYQWPKDFELQYSSDNANWTTAFAITNDALTTPGGTRTYSAPAVTTAKHFWRLQVQEKNDSYCCIGRLQFRTSIGGASITTGGVGSASNANTSPVSGAFDSDPNSFWGTNTNTPWIQYNWGYNQNKEIVEFAVSARGDGFAIQTPKSFDLQYSTNGTNWTTVKSVTNQTGWAVGETRVFTV